MTFFRNFWSDAELSLLKTMWQTPGHPTADIAAALNRSRESVRAKAMKMNYGLKADAPPKLRNGVWSSDPAMVARARHLYLVLGHSAAQVAEALGLGGRNHIIGFANRQGWKRETTDTPKAKRPSQPKRMKPRLRVIANAQTFAEPEPRPVRTFFDESAFHLAGHPNARPWEQRQPQTCCWPLDGPEGETWSCCQPCEGTYCDGCLAIRTAPALPAKRVRRAA